MEALLLRIKERFSSLKRKTANVKYHDGKDYIDLPADDIDSFIDMIGRAQQERENLKRITLHVNEIAFTQPDVKTQLKRERLSPSPSPTTSAGSPLRQNAKKRPKVTTPRPRCLEEEFSTAKPVFQYGSPTQKFFKKLEDEKNTTAGVGVKETT